MDKQKIEDLREKYKSYDEEIKTLNPLVTKAKQALEAIEKELKSSHDSTKSLFDDKRALNTKLTEIKTLKSALYESFKKEQDEYLAQQKIEREKQKAAEAAEREAEKEARILQAAERELEEADIPAYSGEIAVCDALIKFFYSQSPEYATKMAELSKVEHTHVKVPGRKVEEAIPARASVIARKEDREEDFLCLGNKKQKKTKKATTAATKALKMDLELIEKLGQLAIEIPQTISDVPVVVDALEKKKNFYKENSAAKTAANKKAALTKITKLKEKIVVSEVTDE